MVAIACGADGRSRAEGGGDSDKNQSEPSGHEGGDGTMTRSSGGATVTRGGSSSIAGAIAGGQGGTASRDSADNTGLKPTVPAGLSAYPDDNSKLTRGGTMTFTDVGAAGFWARRLNRDAGDPACNIKDGLDTWGGHCCLSQHNTDRTKLAPFDEEMTLLLKMVQIRQLAIYQPNSDAVWFLVSAFDDRVGQATNLWFTATGNGGTSFPGDLRDRDCVWYVTQGPLFDCGDGRDYFCPDDPGVLHRGFSGSKLIVMRANLDVDDASAKACSGDGAGHPGPWIALVASELTRDGGRKWNGACNCYSRNGSVGDGCGEINLFEVVMDNNDWSNREFISTGVRSYQAGHVGGSVCGAGCARSQFPTEAEVVDACAKTAYATAPALPMGGGTQGCPVWVRPQGDRYLVVLLDEQRRMIQVAILHPRAIPKSLVDLLPVLPNQIFRDTIDAVLDLRIPGEN